MIKEYKNHITFPLPFLYILKCKNSGVAGVIGIDHYSANIPIGGEIVYTSGLGLIVVSSTSSGHSALFLKASNSITKLHETSANFSAAFDVTCIGSSITIKNIHTSSRSIEIVAIAYTGRPY